MFQTTCDYLRNHFLSNSTFLQQLSVVFSQRTYSFSKGWRSLPRGRFWPFVSEVRFLSISENYSKTKKPWQNWITLLCAIGIMSILHITPKLLANLPEGKSIVKLRKRSFSMSWVVTRFQRFRMRKAQFGARPFGRQRVFVRTPKTTGAFFLKFGDIFTYHYHQLTKQSTGSHTQRKGRATFRICSNQGGKPGTMGPRFRHWKWNHVQVPACSSHSTLGV